MLPAGAQAFEIQGEDTDLPESPAEALGLNPVYTLPQFEGSSLAMPYSSSASDAGFVSDYGNAIAIPAHFLFLVGMYVAWRRARRNAKNTDAYGSARWATAPEIEKTGLLNGDGVFLGVVREQARGKGTYLRHSDPQHVLGFAPTRSGKGVGWVIPTLLTWRESVLVHDIKGENWALTAGWRAAGCSWLWWPERARLCYTCGISGRPEQAG